MLDLMMASSIDESRAPARKELPAIRRTRGAARLPLRAIASSCRETGQLSTAPCLQMSVNPY